MIFKCLSPQCPDRKPVEAAFPPNCYTCACSMPQVSVQHYPEYVGRDGTIVSTTPKLDGSVTKLKDLRIEDPSVTRVDLRQASKFVVGVPVEGSPGSYIMPIYYSGFTANDIKNIVASFGGSNVQISVPKPYEVVIHADFPSHLACNYKDCYETLEQNKPTGIHFELIVDYV